MSRPPAGRLVALFALMAFAFGAISVRLVVVTDDRIASCLLRRS